MSKTKLSIEETGKLADVIQAEVGKVVLGKQQNIELLMAAVLANGNILFEDFPGLAKTLMSNTLADTLGCKFKRIQFTPDLLPADITGSYFFDPEKNKFTFREGPIFCNLLLADEINRAPPKTQAALLEAMQEKQITIEGTTHVLERPFIVLATQNPIEYEGTYPLPEAQMDRFLVKLSVGYPDEEVETAILAARAERKHDAFEVESISSPGQVVAMHRAVEEVFVKQEIMQYMVSLVQGTRGDPRVAVGSSPRGSLGLFKLSRALALLSGRDYVVPDDVKRSVIPVLAHRIILKPEARIRGVKPEQVLAELLTAVDVPAVKVEDE
ncbi:MAG: magnesium chelatase [Euryarchaeota archaeon]|jgi:MoxR-like ATPase|nr:magnesium chelatase [Euryarchaeota archaeon]MDP6363671.1 MoxR family ATPase [Candidatus Poseidoniia archaeon]MDP6658507.1 MoxR family ATPase [Candidatus Poseidoniia archaeon]MDP6846198.1 MoxR family ATPase [Candidatus Poseidoniia archaeon]MDP7007471.1 MoxR family ATPase [Candidatus Poseidoniia archaeon]|tara:strand:- start:4107 stop:5084 length:978 start_codon:yes stop_codon:yes gene_type:complete